MTITTENGVLLAKFAGELLRIEAWGTDALRIRSTVNPQFTGKDNALSEPHSAAAQISVDGGKAAVCNGRICAQLDLEGGWLEIFRDGEPVLKEYYRAPVGANPYSVPLRIYARQYDSQKNSDAYAITARFEARKGEKLFGMGQYQQEAFNLKGCILELVQRNSQVSVPFCISSCGYGILWNNPGMGQVVFGTNLTQWHSDSSQELDYWITVADTPRELLRNYTQVTGRSPEFPENALGLWQSKLRYRTQEEVLSVAREYHRRGLPLDVVVIDFYHWVRDGEWAFDPEYWPDPKAMTKQLHQMGTRCMVSVWPTVDPKCSNYRPMLEAGMLIRAEQGVQGGFRELPFYDATNPEARDYLWERCKENYYDLGIDGFWLDVSEPEYLPADPANYRYHAGPVSQVMSCYPLCHNKGFYDHMRAEGKTDIVNLTRSAWAGSQKHGAVVWSGDVKSNFENLRVQLTAGLNIGMAGIPWWTTDIGGFMDGDVRDPDFHELLIRWFQFAVFTPVLRMHGDRKPFDIPNLSDLPYGGGCRRTGQPNELWSYGETVYEILKEQLQLRLSLKDYIKSLMDQSSEDGSPLIRAMFYEFPEDSRCWELDDQYMFGSRYLVAPVMYPGMRQRSVYLPAGSWKDIYTGQVLTGGTQILAQAPLEQIPVFEKRV